VAASTIPYSEISKSITGPLNKAIDASTKRYEAEQKSWTERYKAWVNIPTRIIDETDQVIHAFDRPIFHYVNNKKKGVTYDISLSKLDFMMLSKVATQAMQAYTNTFYYDMKFSNSLLLALANIQSDFYDGPTGDFKTLSRDANLLKLFAENQKYYSGPLFGTENKLPDLGGIGGWSPGKYVEDLLKWLQMG
jgi:hypothetical protein